MKCEIPVKNKKNSTNLSSSELVKRVVKIEIGLSVITHATMLVKVLCFQTCLLFICIVNRRLVHLTPF